MSFISHYRRLVAEKEARRIHMEGVRQRNRQRAMAKLRATNTATTGQRDDYETRAQQRLAKISVMAWQIDHDPVQVAEMKQAEQEAPYRQHQAIIAQHRAVQAEQLQRVRNLQAARGGW